MSPRPTVDTQLAAKVLEALSFVSERRLKSALDGEKVCIPVGTARQLAKALEAAYPGALASYRRGLAEQRRSKANDVLVVRVPRPPA